MNNYYLYYHYTADTNELFYIGKGKRRRAWETTRRNNWWNRKVSKHGLRVEIVQNNISNEEAIMLEIDMIALNRKMGKKLVNLTDGGDGASGCIISSETRIKMSASQKRRITSPETRAKLSVAGVGHKNSLGYKHTPETRAKMSAARMGNKIGYKHSIETRNKISNTLKGNIPWNRHKSGLQVAWNKGKKHSAETRAKISTSQKERLAKLR